MKTKPSTLTIISILLSIGSFYEIIWGDFKFGVVFPVYIILAILSWRIDNLKKKV